MNNALNHEGKSVVFTAAPTLSAVVSMDGREVFRLTGLPAMSGTEMATALNAHADLCAALSEVVSQVSAMQTLGETKGAADSWLTRARAALAKAAP